jgi:peptide/nickel transport system permease protein
MATNTQSEFPAEAAAFAPAKGEPQKTIAGRSPWYLAWRRLRRNYVALAFLAVFILIVACCALAPIYSRYVADRGPNDGNLSGTITENGKKIPVVSNGHVQILPNGQTKLFAGGIPIGPQLFDAGGKYVLGADTQGRDVAVRLLYGGLTSLLIGIGSALICTIVALILSLIAAYYGGSADWIISRFYDIIWAFPVLLLAIALGTALALNGLHMGPISIQAGSLWIPTLIISYVLIPYIGRPLRGQLLSLREKEFVEAAVAQGASPVRIMFVEMLPNVASTVLVFFTLIIANNILTEAALSFLGAGVQPPHASWGNLISDGEKLIVSDPWFALAPGIALVLTVLSLNVFGDGLRDALDPRSTVKLEH